MKILLALVSLMMVPLLANGSTFYVAKSGSNSNTCTQAKTLNTAKLTIAAGTACLAAGDTLIIGAGTYPEGISLGAIPSGTDDAHHTVVQGAANASVRLTGAGSNADVVEISMRSFITLDNLELIGGLDGGGGTAVNAGVRVGESGAGWEASYILLSNLIIHHIGAGIYGAANYDTSHITMRSLTVYHNGWPFVGPYHGHNVYLAGHDMVLEDSDIYDGESHGVHVYGNGVAADRIIVRNNRIHDNGSWGVTLSSGNDNLAYNNLIYNNNFTNNGSGGIRNFGGCVRCQILNNTVYGNTDHGIWVQDGLDGIVKNNISYGNSGTAILAEGTATISSNNLTTDPLFLNATSKDFRLMPGSAAIDRGTSLSSILTTDFNGSPRSGTAYDIGAFEYGGSSQISPPANLHLAMTQ